MQSIKSLYTQFEEAEAAYKAVPEAEEKRWQRALDKQIRLARQIVRAPAADVAEMLLKVRVAAWDIGDLKYERLEELDGWKPTRLSRGAEYDALATLREDLKRLQAA